MAQRERRISSRDTPRDATVPAGPRWSQQVTRHSNALDLEPGVFTLQDPRRVAASLRRSADRSTRRRSDAFRSAMSMLCFYINRAGRRLDADTLRRLERAKDELRILFGRRAAPARGRRAPRAAGGTTDAGHPAAPRATRRLPDGST
jgi:hypothetical protein